MKDFLYDWQKLSQTHVPQQIYRFVLICLVINKKWLPFVKRPVRWPNSDTYSLFAVESLAGRYTIGRALRYACL